MPHRAGEPADTFALNAGDDFAGPAGALLRGLTWPLESDEHLIEDHFIDHAHPRRGREHLAEEAGLPGPPVQPGGYSSAPPLTEPSLRTARARAAPRIR